MTLVEILRSHGHSLREAEELVEEAVSASGEVARLERRVDELEATRFRPELAEWSRLA